MKSGFLCVTKDGNKAEVCGGSIRRCRGMFIIFMAYCTIQSASVIFISKLTGLENWKYSGKKRSWPHRGIIPIFTCHS